MESLGKKAIVELEVYVKKKTLNINLGGSKETRKEI